tara:strand:- start:1612 stop:2265 length:654 start_codon:yes stop_codon:yes gene_type:complete
MNIGASEGPGRFFEDGQWRKDDAAQLLVRDGPIVEHFYSQLQVKGWKFRQVDDVATQKRGVDVMLTKIDPPWADQLITVEEKIVRSPGPKKDALKAFLFEDKIEYSDGRVGFSWARTCEADRLLYAFCGEAGDIRVFWMNWPVIKAHFWEKYGKDHTFFPDWTSRQKHKLHCKLVPLSWVREVTAGDTAACRMFYLSAKAIGEEHVEVVKAYNRSKY